MDRRRSPARSSVGALALILLQGVCVWGETVTAVVGGSVVLPSGYQKEDVSIAEWQFGKNSSYLKPTAELVKNILYEYDPFKGRLEMNPYNFSLTVRKLTKEDSGVFLFTGRRKSGGQIRSKIVQLQVYDSTLKEVNIKKTVTLHQPNNTCTFNFLCNASGPPDVTFSWSGYRTGNGASLHLSLSPADGSVMLKCTAASGESSLEKSVTVSCNNKTLNNSDDTSPTPSTDTERFLYFVLIPAAGGVLLLIILSIAVGVCCCRRHKVDNSSVQNTLYADVFNHKGTTQRSTSVTNEMSIYETVDERSVGIQSQPQTLYDKVNFSRGKKEASSTLSSPYQEVL